MMRDREKIPAFLKKNERSKNYQFDLTDSGQTFQLMIRLVT